MSPARGDPHRRRGLVASLEPDHSTAVGGSNLGGDRQYDQIAFYYVSDRRPLWAELVTERGAGA